MSTDFTVSTTTLQLQLVGFCSGIHSQHRNASHRQTSDAFVWFHISPSSPSKHGGTCCQQFKKHGLPCLEPSQPTPCFVRRRIGRLGPIVSSFATTSTDLPHNDVPSLQRDRAVHGSKTNDPFVVVAAL